MKLDLSLPLIFMVFVLLTLEFSVWCFCTFSFLPFFCWQMHCLSFDWQLLITPFVIFKNFFSSNELFYHNFNNLLCCLSFCDLPILITSLISSNSYYYWNKQQIFMWLPFHVYYVSSMHMCQCGRGKQY